MDNDYLVKVTTEHLDKYLEGMSTQEEVLQQLLNLYATQLLLKQQEKGRE